MRRPLESAQDCSNDDQAELRRHGVRISMSGKGDGCGDAMIETFFKTLKAERVWRTVFLTQAEAEAAIGRFYNPVRRHSALDFVSPAVFERQAGHRATRSPSKRGKSRMILHRSEIDRAPAADAPDA